MVSGFEGHMHETMNLDPGRREAGAGPGPGPAAKRDNFSGFVQVRRWLDMVVGKIKIWCKKDFSVYMYYIPTLFFHFFCPARKSGAESGICQERPVPFVRLRVLPRFTQPVIDKAEDRAEVLVFRT